MDVKVGTCLVDTKGEIIELKREFYGQGMIFKDEYAFYHKPQEPCYVPELSDTLYTGEDFLRMCNDQDDVAEDVFGAVDWQHPESYLDEQFAHGEMAVCKSCEKIFLSYMVEKCPYCNCKVAVKED